MKKQILITGLLSATLLFLIKLFETKFMSGQLSVKLYITITGIIFLAAEIWQTPFNDGYFYFTQSSQRSNDFLYKLHN